MLNNENNFELEGIFTIHIIDKLNHVNLKEINQEVRDKISSYLESIKYRYNTNNKNLMKENISIFNYGRWLEAYSLINAYNHNEAIAKIMDFIKDRKKKDQKVYIIGLSNNNHIQNALKNLI